jgi:hypothetical protein
MLFSYCLFINDNDQINLHDKRMKTTIKKQRWGKIYSITAGNLQLLLNMVHVQK